MTRRSLLLVARVAAVGLLAALAFGVATASGDTAGAPVSTNGPIINGSPGVGKTLRVTTGSWSTPATFTYQWVRCIKGYKGCADLPGSPTYAAIPGATKADYVPVLADVGHVLVALVTATNSSGSTTIMSSGNGLVEAKRPGVKHVPWIRGTKKLGRTVAVTDAVWTRSPYQFTQQWLRCSSTGDACHRITGKRKICDSSGPCLHVNIGTDSSYTLTAKDVGHRIRVRAIAWNGAGRASSTSAPTRIITG